MAVRLTHQEIEELLGAYALDAVDGDEQVEISDHLLECPRCRAEVPSTGRSRAPRPRRRRRPAGLWDRIAASIEGTEPSAADVALVPPPALFARPGATRSGQRSWHSRAFLPIVAAAAAVIALLGFQVVDQGQKIDQQGEQLAQMSTDDG
jgi:anti-sigma factor RsiW